MKSEFEKLIFDALRKAKARKVNIYTFAIYHDHESNIVSVCIDTIENSNRSALASRVFSREQFFKNIDNGDLDGAKLWNSGGERNFSLGDFAYVNLSEIDVPNRPKVPEFYLEMVSAIRTMEELVSRQSEHGKNLVYCCSTSNSEVGLIW